MNRPAPLPSLTIARVNPLEHAEAIKALFTRHDRPEFSAYYDRAYPALVGDGAASWVARTPDGSLAMHIARIPHRFTFGKTTITAGLLANQMVAHGYRSFFPARELVRRVVQDAREDGGLDLLYADPNESSGAVLKALGFVHFATLGRFVLPVSDRRRYLSVAARAWGWLARFRAGVFHAERCREHPASGFDPATATVPLGEAARLRAIHPEYLYRCRLAGYPGADDHWLVYRLARDATRIAAVLVRGPDRSGLAEICALNCLPGTSIASLQPGLVRASRDWGCHRLNITTLLESDFAHELVAAGFVRRADRAPVLGLALTEAGERAIGAPASWEVTAIDFDR